MSSKVRRLGRVSRIPAMATSDGESGPRRRKRAWRQPRHAAGYASSEATVEPPTLRSNGVVEDESTASAASRSTADVGKGTESTRPHTSQYVADEQPVGQQRQSASDGTEKRESGERPLPSAGEEVAAKELEEAVKRTTGAVAENERLGEGGVTEMTEIDGSVMEGGGQILRNAIALSCLLRRQIRITRIRAGRSKPGLRPQHLAGLHLIGQLCGGKLAGDSVNSTVVELCPSSIRNGDYSADTQTAGSTSLLLQVALPCLLFAPDGSSSTLTLKGGTDADMAPPIDYIVKVFKPVAAKFGVSFECELKKRGFYPRGGGEVVVKPHSLRHLTPATITEPGHVVSVSVHAYVAGTVPEKIAHQLAQSARQQVERQLSGVAVMVSEVRETAATAYGSGSGLIVVAETNTGCLLGGSANGKRDDPPYKTGRAAADQMLRAVKEGACVDEHLQDQLVILMALAKGRSVVRTGAISLHTKTAIHIARSLTPAVFNIRKLDGGAHLIECDGMGLENTSYK